MKTISAKESRTILKWRLALGVCVIYSFKEEKGWFYSDQYNNASGSDFEWNLPESIDFKLPSFRRTFLKRESIKKCAHHCATIRHHREKAT